MGAAAYRRGNVVISRQADADLKASRLVSVERGYVDALEGQVETLRAQLADLRAENARLRLRWRERCATLTAERRDRADNEARLLNRARSAEGAMLLFRRRWEWVSRVVRAYVRPSEVHEFRDLERGASVSGDPQ